MKQVTLFSGVDPTAELTANTPKSHIYIVGDGNGCIPSGIQRSFRNDFESLDTLPPVLCCVVDIHRDVLIIVGFAPRVGSYALLLMGIYFDLAGSDCAAPAAAFGSKTIITPQQSQQERSRVIEKHHPL
jgi:hypothetical protein